MTKAIDALGALLEKAVGKSAEEGEITQWLDTDYPPLNEILSNHPDRGLPYGRIVEIYGGPGSGKTGLALTLMIMAQQMGGFAGFSDHEHALDQALAVKNGLSVDPGKYLYKRPETWEESNMLALKAGKTIRDSKLIAPEAPIIWVFDSVAAMIPQSMLYDSKGKPREIDSMSMNDTTALSRVSSTTLKIINKMASDLNMVIVYLNQTRTKPGVTHGDPTTTPGGSSFEFYATTRLSLGRSLERDSDKDVIGQTTRIKTQKNKQHRSFLETEMILVYPEGGGAVFDKTYSLLLEMRKQGKLETAGAYIVWEGKKYYARALADKIDAEGGYAALKELYKNPIFKKPVAATAAAAAVDTLANL